MARLLIATSLRRHADRWPFLQRVLWLLEAGFLWVFIAMAGLLSPERAAAMGRGLVKWFSSRQPKSRNIRRNLMLAFPQKSEEEIDELVREVWGGAGALLGEYAHLEDICRQGANGRLEIVVLGDVAAFREEGRPAIFVTAHLGNWEVCAAAIRRHGVPLASVYTPLQNPWLDRLLQRRRRFLDTRLIMRDDAMRPLIRELDQGTSLGLVMDQRMDSGKPVPFFGIDKGTTLVPARLALRHGAELVPMRPERLDGGRFRVTFYPPIRPDDPEASEMEQALQMTRQVNRLFEEWIRECPGEWFCSRRIWSKDARPAAMGRDEASSAAA